MGTQVHSILNNNIKRRNPKSPKRVGKNNKCSIMKEVIFNVVETAIAENGLFSYANFAQNGPCDMCWGDLSL